MKNLIFKGNKYSCFLILLVMILISGWFYWYELRPAKIRQECSWVKHTDEAIPAKPTMSEEELKANGLIKNCVVEETQGYKSIYDKYLASKDTCEKRNKLIIEDYKTVRPEVPAKDWYSKAPEKTYDFCIKSKGITR